MSKSKRDEIIREFFNDPKTGLFSTQKLLSKLREIDPNITADDVNRVLDKQETVQINKDIKRGVYNKIVAFKPNDVWQVDLLDVQNLASVNKNYRYILNIVDVYSRFLISAPLKDKKGETVASALKKIIETYGAPDNWTSDHGNEFLNAHVKGLLKNTEVWLHPIGSHNTLGIVERMNRTMRELFRKWFAMRGTKIWVNVHADIVENYNNTVHSTTKQKPIDVYNGVSFPNAERKIRSVKTFKPGDLVRVKTERKIFDKPEQRYSKMIYTIVKKSGKSYVVMNESGHELQTKYRADQLLKIVAPDDAVDDDETPTIVKEAVKTKKLSDLHKSLDNDSKNIVETKRVRKLNSKFKDFV